MKRIVWNFEFEFWSLNFFEKYTIKFNSFKLFVYNVQQFQILVEGLSFVKTFATFGIMWNIYEIIHICTAVVDESEVWSSQ